MYQMRFLKRWLPISPWADRGMEGGGCAALFSIQHETGVPWQGRRYGRGNWDNADPINRALSAGNALLNGICHAAIVSGGYSPAWDSSTPVAAFLRL
jgi:CRISPR-associated protein Cas1